MANLARRKRRRRRARRNPHGIPTWALVTGGVAVVGVGGYFLWRYMAQNIAVAPGGQYTPPAGTITVTFPNVSAAQVIYQGTSIIVGSTGVTQNVLSFNAVSGTTYNVSWTDSNSVPQTATIIAQ